MDMENLDMENLETQDAEMPGPDGLKTDGDGLPPPIPAGAVVIANDGQKFTCAGHIPFLRRDGKIVFCCVWQSQCRFCDQPVLNQGYSRSIDLRAFRKNCPAHKNIRKEPRP